MKRIIHGTRKEFNDYIEIVRDKHMKKETISSSDVFDDIQTLERNTLILDKRDGKIIKILSPREIFFLMDLITILKLEDDAERILSIKELKNSKMNRTALLVFLALFKDDLGVEEFEILTRQAIVCCPGSEGFTWEEED